jgi:hypothetical protein
MGTASLIANGCTYTILEQFFKVRSVPSTSGAGAGAGAADDDDVDDEEETETETEKDGGEDEEEEDEEEEEEEEEELPNIAEVMQDIGITLKKLLLEIRGIRRSMPLDRA